MQNSTKHFIASLTGFAALTISTLLVMLFCEEYALSFATISNMGLAAVLAAICIMVAIRHIKARRYFISLSMVMVCFSFSYLYSGLCVVLYGADPAFAASLFISDIAYLGACAFIAALSARIWYEEILKSHKRNKKDRALSLIAALILLIIGGIGIIAGYPILSGILTTLFGIAAIWFPIRFFTGSSAEKPFIPLMTVIAAYLILEMTWTLLLPLLPETSYDIIAFTLTMVLTLLEMLCIPCLLLAGELVEKRAEIKSLLQDTQETA